MENGVSFSFVNIKKNLDMYSFICHLFGLRYSDGCIYKQKRNNSYTFYICFGKEKDAITFIYEFRRIFNRNINYYYGSRAYYAYLPAELARLFISLGSPTGNKVTQLFRLPTWVFNLSDKLKWEFLSGLFSGDGSCPRLKKGMYSSESLKISLSSEDCIVEDFRDGFMQDIYILLKSLDLEISKPKIEYNNPRLSKNKKISYPVNIRILSKKNNMKRFLENIEFRFNNKYTLKTNELLDVLAGKFHLKELEDYVKYYEGKNPTRLTVLLKNNLSKELLTGCSNKLGGYELFAKYLKNCCPSLYNVTLNSISHRYVYEWKRGSKYIPIDCVIEMLKLLRKDKVSIYTYIERVKFKNLGNSSFVLLDKLK